MPDLSEVLRQIAQWDGAALEWLHELHWGPLTAVFVIASAWWVKWPLIAAAGGCCDAARRRLPTAALAATIAAAIAGGLTTLIKQATDRPRPPLADSTIDPLVSLPSSTSFPSGHAATAFATATAVALLYPRLKWPLLAVAALVALSRVYLGVHFWSDVVVGSLLGAAIGLATALVVQRAPHLSFARLRRSPG